MAILAIADRWRSLGTASTTEQLRSKSAFTTDIFINYEQGDL